MMGAIGYLTTKLGVGYNGKDPKKFEKTQDLEKVYVDILILLTCIGMELRVIIEGKALALAPVNRLFSYS